MLSLGGETFVSCSPFAYFWSPSLKKPMWTCSWQNKGQHLLLCGSHHLPHLLERAASPQHSSVSLNFFPFLQSAPHCLQRPDFFVSVSPKAQSLQVLNWPCAGGIIEGKILTGGLQKFTFSCQFWQMFSLVNMSKCLKSSACSWSAPHGQAPQDPISCNKGEVLFWSLFLLSFQ